MNEYHQISRNQPRNYWYLEFLILLFKSQKAIMVVDI